MRKNRMFSAVLVAVMLATSCISVGALTGYGNLTSFDGTSFTSKSTQTYKVVNDTTKIWTGSLTEFIDENGTSEISKYLFLDNYSSAKNANSTITYEQLEAIVEGAEYTDLLGSASSDDAGAKEVVKAFNNFFAGTQVDNALDAGYFNSNKSIKDNLMDKSTSTGDYRKSIQSEYSDNLSTITVNGKLDLEYLGYFDVDELISYNIYNKSNLSKSLCGVMVNSATANSSTVYMEYLNDAYNSLFSLVGYNQDIIDTFEEKLSEAKDLDEDLYSTSAWNRIKSEIRQAEQYASSGDYANALKHIEAALSIEGEGANDTSDLKYSLASLFIGSKSVTAEEYLEKQLAGYTKALKPEDFKNGDLLVYNFEGENTRSGLAVYGKGSNCLYSSDDYNRMDWEEFAGYDDGRTIETLGAYRKAMIIYAATQSESLDHLISQDAVDDAYYELESSIKYLDRVGVADWLMEDAEELLETASKIKAEDYKETSYTWKNFKKAYDALQELVDDGDAGQREFASAVEKLRVAIEKLEGTEASVSSTLKKELRDLLRDVELALKNTTGKTAEQIKQLETVYKEVNKERLETISEYNEAIAKLEEALVKYNQKLGWYKNSSGKWLMGTVDGVKKGWYKDDKGTWYLLDDKTGEMKTGWHMVNGTWYYMKDWGGMATGWQFINNKWYYMQSWGGMAKGWNKVGNTWYYHNASGDMVSNCWKWINGKCYYFYPSGAMAANTTIDGCKVDKSGAWVY